MTFKTVLNCMRPVLRDVYAFCCNGRLMACCYNMTNHTFTGVVSTKTCEITVYFSKNENKAIIMGAHNEPNYLDVITVHMALLYCKSKGIATIEAYFDAFSGCYGMPKLKSTQVGSVDFSIDAALKFIASNTLAEWVRY